MANELSRFELDDIALHLAQIASQIVVIVNLAQETDALRVAPMGWCQVFTLCNLAHLVLHHVADGEQGFRKLPVVDLSQEIGLVLDGIGAGAKPFQGVGGRTEGVGGRTEGVGGRTEGVGGRTADHTILVPPSSFIVPRSSFLYLRGGIVAGGNEIVVVATLLVEGTELDETIAHDVGIRGQARAYLIHRVLRHVVPVLSMAVDDFQATAVLMADGRGHLQVFFAGAVPLLFLLRTYLDIEAVGLQSLTHQFVEHDAGVNTAAEQYSYPLILDFLDIHH